MKYRGQQGATNIRLWQDSVHWQWLEPSKIRLSLVLTICWLHPLICMIVTLLSVTLFFFYCFLTQLFSDLSTCLIFSLLILFSAFSPMLSTSRLPFLNSQVQPLSSQTHAFYFPPSFYRECFPPLKLIEVTPTGLSYADKRMAGRRSNVVKLHDIIAASLNWPFEDIEVTVHPQTITLICSY